MSSTLIALISICAAGCQAPSLEAVVRCSDFRIKVKQEHFQVAQNTPHFGLNAESRLASITLRFTKNKNVTSSWQSSYPWTKTLLNIVWTFVGLKIYL